MSSTQLACHHTTVRSEVWETDDEIGWSANTYDQHAHFVGGCWFPTWSEAIEYANSASKNRHEGYCIPYGLA